jgi:cellulose biosynthesis protein BcsQ
MVNYDTLNRVVAVATGKGGTGKTSLTANAAGLMAAAGHRVLVIDLDPQGDISDDLGYFDDERADDGRHLATAMQTGAPLAPVLTDVRPNLDVVTGGSALTDISGVLLARQSRGKVDFDLLATCLEPIADNYDLILIDTPPNDDLSQLLALTAARYLLIPTKADPASIRAIRRIAERVAEARAGGRDIDILGVVLVGVPTAAKRVRGNAEEMIVGMLGQIAPLFEGGIRDSSAVAQETRIKGVLAHELAEQVDGAEPFWAALRKKAEAAKGAIPGLGAFDTEDAVKPTRIVKSAPALASDYIAITEQVMRRISELENTGEGAA